MSLKGGSKVKKDKGFIIIAILYVILVILSFYSHTSNENIINKQNKIIAKQQDVNYAQQNVIEEQGNVIRSLEQQVEDEKTVSNILYDICKVHNLLEEVE